MHDAPRLIFSQDHSPSGVESGTELLPASIFCEMSHRKRRRIDKAMLCGKVTGHVTPRNFK